MKKIFVIALTLTTFLPTLCHADDLLNLKSWLLSQPIKIGTAVDFKGSASGVSYLSIISLGQSGFGAGEQKAMEFASMNAGIDFSSKKAKLLLIPMLKPHNVGSVIWQSLPNSIQSRVQHLGLPDMELGLAVNIDQQLLALAKEPHEPFVIGKDVRLVAAFKF